MVLRAEQEKIKALLKDTITLLCKNGLSFKAEFCIEALIGITLDQDNIVLVSINETVKSELALKQGQGYAQETEAEGCVDHSGNLVDEDGADLPLEGSRITGQRLQDRHIVRKRRISKQCQIKSEYERSSDCLEVSHGEPPDWQDTSHDASSLHNSSSVPSLPSISRFSGKRPRLQGSRPVIPASQGGVDTPVVIKDETDADGDWSSCDQPQGLSDDQQIPPPFSLADDSQLYQRDVDLSQALGVLESKSLPMSAQWPGDSLNSHEGGDGESQLNQQVNDLFHEASNGNDSQPIESSQTADKQRTGYNHNPSYPKMGQQQPTGFHGHRSPPPSRAYFYSCQVCGKGFSSTTNLRGHMVQHTAVREHVCRLCGKEYVFKKNLQQHVLKAHGDWQGQT